VVGTACVWGRALLKRITCGAAEPAATGYRSAQDMRCVYVAQLVVGEYAKLDLLTAMDAEYNSE
jgi:hypothetical protein